jgi:hypothetical protein
VRSAQDPRERSARRKEASARSVRLTRAAALLGALAALLTTTPPPAHADFVAKTCNASPSPQWIEGFAAVSPWYSVTDTCTQTGGTYAFNNGAPSQQTFNTNTGAIIRIPSGETLTHISASFHSLDVSGTEPANLQAGYDNTVLLDSPMGDDHAGTHLSVDVPNASSFWLRVYCTYAQGPVDCQWNTSNGVIQAGEIDFTLHDTGVPSVRVTGGTFKSSGIVAGGQTLQYQASDAGSGVAKVTLALGPVVVGTVASTCYAWNLQPCPSSTTGTFDVDTHQLPDGTYPVVITSYDESGNATPVQVSTVTVRNGTGAGGILGNFNPGPTFAGHVPNGSGATPAAKLRISFQVASQACGSKHRRRARCRARVRYPTGLTRSYTNPQPATVMGTLLNSCSQPIAGAKVLIAVATGSSPYVVVAQGTTDGSGHFAYGLPGGASRLVEAIYWPFADQDSYASSNAAALNVPAALTLRARHLRGRTVLFTGRVLTGPIPAQGIPLELQVRLPSPNGRYRWQDFRGAHADPTGRFAVRYPLAYRYAIRIAVRTTSGYPFGPGHSAAVVA